MLVKLRTMEIATGDAIERHAYTVYINPAKIIDVMVNESRGFVTIDVGDDELSHRVSADEWERIEPLLTGDAPQSSPEPTDDEILEWRLIRAWALTTTPPVGKNGLFMLSLAAKYEQKLAEALSKTDLNAALEDPRGTAPTPVLPADVIAAYQSATESTYAGESLRRYRELGEVLHKYIPADSEDAS